MRPIKFRAWDAETKRMVDLGKPLYDTYYGGILFHAIAPIVGKWELMQFTGLTDKNGKEIYEGDIVRYNHGNITHTTGVVAYMGAAFGMNGWLLNMCGMDVTEVIGNIYENPELLSV